MDIIPITKPSLGVEEEKTVIKVLRSGWLSQGKVVEEFERSVAEYVGVAYAVATSSCTTALHISLLAMGLKEGDEVICPSYTFVATVNAILYCGAKPVLVDIDPENFNMDAARVEEAITMKTKGILLVHQLGLPADIDVFHELAEVHGLWVVEDAAAALGAAYKKKKAGGHSILNCVSFHPRKIITTGEGGVITTSNKELWERLKRLRNHGVTVDAYFRENKGKPAFEKYVELGFNYRLSDILAAVGVEQMKKLDFFAMKRREKAEKYREYLQNTPLGLPIEPFYATHNFTTYQVLLPLNLKAKRNEIIEKMQEKGVAVKRGIPPVHREKYYTAMFGKTILPVTEDVSERAIFIPIYPDLGSGEQRIVVENLLYIMEKALKE